jgi:hypothetical protein
MLEGLISTLMPQQQQALQGQFQDQQQLLSPASGGMQVTWVPVMGPIATSRQGVLGTIAATYQPQPQQQQQQQLVYAQHPQQMQQAAVQQPQQMQQTVILQQQQQSFQQEVVDLQPSYTLTVPMQPPQQTGHYQQQQQVQVSACGLQEPLLIHTSEGIVAAAGISELQLQSGGQGMLSQSGTTLYIPQGSQLQGPLYRTQQ